MWFATCLLAVSFAFHASAVPAATTAAVCKQLPYILFLPLSNYAPAMSFCSTEFPVAPITTTSTILTTTTQVSVSVQTIATTTTTTVAGPPFQKRQAPALASLKALARNLVSTACSCIETPGTVTVNPTSVITALTSTTTTTTSVAVSTAVTRACPASPITGHTKCHCPATVNCGKAAQQGQSFIPTYVTNNVNSIQACIDICDANPSCEEYTLDTVTHVCTTFNVAGRPLVNAPNSVYGVKDDPCSRACKQLP